MAQEWWASDPVAPATPTQQSRAQRPLASPPKQPDPYQVQKDSISQANEAERLDLSRESNARDAARFGQDTAMKPLEMASKLRDDFTKVQAVKDYSVAFPILMSALKTSPDATGDNALIYAYAKIMDPNSVVRESEMGMAASGASVFDSTVANLKKQFGIEGGGQLPNNVRERLKQEMNSRVSQYAKAYGASRRDYQDMAKRYGLNPTDIVGTAPAGPFLEEYDRLTVLPEERGDAPSQAGSPGVRVLPDGTLSVDVTDDSPPDGSSPPPDRSDPLSQIDAGVRGAADIVTFGLADKLSAAMSTIFGGGTYQGNLAKERAINAQDSKDGYGRIIGQLAGGLAVPMGRLETLGQAVGKGAGFGGAYGFNSSDAPFSDRAGETLTGATLGAIGGGAGYYAGKGLNALASRSPRGSQEVSDNMNALLAGERQNIPMRQPDIRPSTRADFAAAEASPSGNPIVTRALESDKAAVRSRLGDVGGSGQPMDRFTQGEAVQEAGKRYIVKTREQANTLYRRAEQMTGDIEVRPDNAIQAIDANIAELTANGANTNSGQIKYLQDLKADLLNGNFSIEKLRAIRTNMRGQINERNLTSTDADRRVGDVLSAASQDIEAALSGNPQALGAYKNADVFYREKQDFIKQVAQKFLGPRNQPISAEQAAQRLNAMMKEGGDSGRFIRMWDQLEPAERADLQASFAENLGRARNGDFSLAALATNMRQINPRTARTVFGKDGYEALRDLQIISEAKTATSSALNNSRTGVVEARNNKFKDIILGVFGGSVGGVPGAIGGMAARSGVEAFSSRRAARLLLNPDFTRWIKNTPNTANPKAINAHFERLNKIAATAPEIAGDAKALQQYLMEAFSQSPTRAAAEDKPDSRGEPPANR